MSILSDARLDDELVQSFVYDPTTNLDGEEADHALSKELFTCIQTYMMCTMKKGPFCMQDYNKCTLKVLDKFNEDIDPEDNDVDSDPIGREGSDQDGVLPPEEEDEESKPEDSDESIHVCDEFDMPDTFGSFSGKPAASRGRFNTVFD